MANKINIGATVSLGGEKEYRQALKNITSEQKLLTSEMKLASAQYSENANSIEALESKNKILSKQIENQTDKVKLYSKAVEDSIEKQKKSADNVEKYKEELAKAQKEMDDLKNSSDATSESLEKQQKTIDGLEKKLKLSETAYAKSSESISGYKTSLNLAEASLEKLNGELSQNESYLKEANVSVDKTASSIDNMGRQIKQAGNETNNFGSSIKSNVTSAAIVGGVVALGYAFEQIASKTIDVAASAAKYADDILTMSTVTGIATDKLQAYNYMAELTDTSMETIEKTMVKNIRSMVSAQKGTEEYVNAYDQLNVAFQDGNKNLLDSETVYWNLIDALGQIEDETKRDSISLTLFGKSAQDLNTLIVQGSEGITAFTDEAKKMGAILDTDTLEKLGKTDDAIQRFTQSTEIMKRKIGAELSDELTKSMTKITNAISDSDDQIIDLAEGGLELLTDGFAWFIDNSDVIIAGLVGISGAMITSKVVDGVMAGVKAYQSLSNIIKTATASQTALNFVQAASPIGLIVTALAGVTAAFVSYNLITKDATTETDRFLESTKSVNESLAQGITSREDNMTALNSEVGFIKTLGTELTTLNEKQKLSTAEQNRMSEIVERLNSQFPDLNLIIDENTGRVEGNTKAIQDAIEKNLEWYKIQAAQEELTSLYKEQADAELEVYKIDQEIKRQKEISTQAQKKQTEAMEEWVAKNEDSNEILYDSTKSYYDLQEAQDVAKDSIEQLTEERDKLTGSQKEQQEQLDILNGYIAENTGLVNENSTATSESSSIYTAYGQEVKNVSEEVKSSIASLNEEYDNAKVSAEDSLTSQVGLFQAAEEQSKISVSEMIDNLQSQTDAFNSYKENILLASQLVSDGLMDKGLLGYIESFGLQGAGYLEELVNAASTDKEKFSQLMTEWAEMNDAKSGLAGTMAELETSYKEGMEKLGIIVYDGNEKLSKNAYDLKDEFGKANELLTGEFTSSYNQMMIDANESIKLKAKDISESTFKLASDSIDALNSGLEVVDGRSLKSARAGAAVVDGFASEITNGTSRVASAFQTMISRSLSSVNITRIINEALGEALE